MKETKKVYCNKCRFNYSRFGMEQCQNAALDNVHYVVYYGISTARQIRKLANKNNDCVAYKRKWWKFWAK